MTGTKDKTKTLAFFISEVLLYLYSAAIQFHNLTGFELVRTAEDKLWLVCCCTPVTFLDMARYAVTVTLVFTIFSVFFYAGENAHHNGHIRHGQASTLPDILVYCALSVPIF